MEKRLLGEKHPSVASILNSLASLYYTQGRYMEAEELYARALRLSEHLGANHPLTASIQRSLEAVDRGKRT